MVDGIYLSDDTYHLKLLIFLPAILTAACESSSLAFYMMHSAYKLNKQWQYTALMYFFHSFGSSSLFLTVASCHKEKEIEGQTSKHDIVTEPWRQIFDEIIRATWL